MKTLKISTLVSFLFINGAVLSGREASTPIIVPTANGNDDPWFTGPLLTPSGNVIPYGYINIEPYLFVNVFTGQYDSHWHAQKLPKFYNINGEILIQIGLAKWMDFSMLPQASYNHTKNQSSYVFNDLICNLDFQLYKDQTHRHPDLKFYIQETFPTGRYQRLKPSKLNTDLGGGGSFATGLGLVLAQVFHIYEKHYLAWRFNPFYTFPAPVHVKGKNAYGGAPNTRGRVRPGPLWGGLFGLEYTLTQNWVLAMDAEALFRNKTRFSGRLGTLPDGTPASMGFPSSVQFSLAPAVEYNFSSSLGLLVGSWFSIGGRNSPRFMSAVIALNYFGPIGSSCIPNK